MKNKQLRVIMVVVLALILAITGLTAKTMMDATKQFSADGYVLVPSRDTEVTTNVNEQYYFSAGTNYRKKYGKTIEFKDTSNNEVSMGTEEFVHYNDGSLGAFTKGVVMDLAEIGDNQVTYYGVSDKTTILKQGQDYSMSYLGNSLTLNEFIWKIADDTFMLVSPEIVLHLTDDIEVVLEDYVQVQYVAGGIARLVHQRGTYQTVSDDAYITTDSGFQLKLTERAFYNGLEKAVSLDEMVIDSSSNLMVDENEESLKIPTFRVVNGKDGEDGADGFTGEDGEDGESGDNGTSGDNGEKGQNGYDGLEGNSGEWGYDGQVGENGKDAENAEIVDGIVGVVQESAPTVALDAESYKVGTNSVDMTLKISDPNGMLTSEDLVCTIYKRDDMTQVYQTTVNSGMTGGVISTQNLQPGTDYVFIVEGSYESDANGLFSGVNFLTKIFRTDELGLSIEKVQVTENSIAVKVVKSDDSQVSTYGIALYLGDDTDTNIATYTGSYSEGREFVFNNTDGVETNYEITPDTEYKIALTNIVSVNASAIGSDVSQDVTTLKTKPYYLNADGQKIDVGTQVTKILTSSRYQTATVSIDTAIKDDYNGIKGYRYELYETTTDDKEITTPIQTKEVQEMETVTFNIEANQRYFARVVVLFDDNEKLVELVTQPSEIVSLTHSTYPTVQFVSVEHQYDSITGYIMVEDNSANQDMLLRHVSSDYPLVLTVTAQTGELHTFTFDTELSADQTPTEGNADTGDSIAYYRFYIDGLARDTTHTVSVSGYVNDTDTTWDKLTADEKSKKFQYLSGYNITLPPPTPVTMSLRQVPSVDDNLFTIALAFTDTNGEDASYEVGNMEKITFRLVNASGVTIGTTANLMDANSEKHKSDYSDFYAPGTTAVDDLPYSAIEGQQYSTYVLTDESFGAKGDLRIANGGTFKIYVDSAYDYTQNDSVYKDVTNELDIVGEVEFEVEESHTRVADPNSAITVTQIRNDDAEVLNPNLDDETIVGLNVDTGYSLSDVHQIIYYIYELTSATDEPLVKDDNPSQNLSNAIDENYWSTKAKVQKKTVNITTAETAGEAARPWVVYFDEMDQNKATANLDDDKKVIFERGKVYYIRYEIVTNGSLEDTKTEKRYPHCAYDGMSDANIPFYRSNVFGISRQEPKIQRYLWDTVSAAAADGKIITTHQWKYKLNDPDNAVLAYFNNDKNIAAATIKQYADFDHAFATDETGTESVAASLTALYDDNTVPLPKATYDLVEVKELANTKWYTIDIPYCLFEANTREEYESVNKLSNVSVPTEVIAVDYLDNTNITTVNNSSTDYRVSGVMVKDVSDTPGVADELGYRIKLTLQGDEIERIAGLKVTLSYTDGTTTKSVVYDPVPIAIRDYTSGENYYAHAYLDYAPIVAAGMHQKTVTMNVDAYYTTNRVGMNSFIQYTDLVHKNGNTTADNLFANNTAWALKQYNYKETNGVTSYNYFYQNIASNLGILNTCQNFIKDSTNQGLETKTLANSIFIPQIDANGVNIGFANESTLALRYAISPLCYTATNDNTFNDIMFTKDMLLEIDAVGARSQDNGEYYVVEQLNMLPLKLDFGDADKDYYEGKFNTGDGMPGVAFSLTGSSYGMSSATLQFDIKGALPRASEGEGYYIYLYNEKTGANVALTKYKDKDDKVYYLAEGGSPTTDQDTMLTADDTATAYSLQPDADSNGAKVTFAIRGLERDTDYRVWLKARNTKDSDNLQNIFDYNLQQGTVNTPVYYTFKTKQLINLVTSDASYVYNTYYEKIVNLNYAVQGSEGTGMRIFYKVYDVANNDAEVLCGKQTYVENYGYVLEPKGNNVKYYQSDMSLCNPVELSFSPNGLLKLGQKYRIEYTAYITTNQGAVKDSTPIGFVEKEFTMPTELKMPRASLRIVSGASSVDVTVTMTDTEKSIHDGKFYVDVYDMAGNRVTSDASRLVFNVNSGTGSGSYSGTISSLPENQAYRIVVTAPVDRNNDGTKDIDYTNELTANTISTATATVTTSYTADGFLTLKLMDLVNFSEVYKVAYSIDSQDGTSNYENASKLLSEWSMSGSTYSYQTGFAPESGTYHYTLQYYSDDNRLIGSTSGYFTR